MENILQNARPFESKKSGNKVASLTTPYFEEGTHVKFFIALLASGESNYDASRRQELRSFWVTGKKGLTFAEASQVIVEEARDLLQKDLGVEIDWGSQEEREKNLSAILNGSSFFSEF